MLLFLLNPKSELRVPDKQVFGLIYSLRTKNVKGVVAQRLCVGCGACAYVCPKNKLKLVDVVSDGIRPIYNGNGCAHCEECLKVCPGYETIHHPLEDRTGLIPGLHKGWGTIREIWEGHAADAEVRYSGSSGGLATALALYCLEKEGMHGALHIGADPMHPWKNLTVLSRHRNDLLSRTGSRYSPASPCDGLNRIEQALGPCVFIGKPCDVAGLRKAQLLRPELDKNVGVAIGIFCAGTPSTQGTLELLRRLNTDPKEVEEIRYRGKGWPGIAAIRLRGQNMPSYQMSYMESWGFLQKYRPYRCYLCPDGTSEFADVSCGDPWYREIQEEAPGYSLVLVRTQRGREIVHGAMEAGYAVLKRANPQTLEESQKNLLAKRRAIWGRIMVMKAFGVPTPRLKGFCLFENWCKLPIKEKGRSILGTARRIMQRRYYKP